MTTEDIFNRLSEGNSRFVSDRLKSDLRGNSRRRSLIGAQKPFAIVLSCADSRVVPELAFDCGLGELFVIRVAGNVAYRSTLASIEYAVAHLNIKAVVVLGHQNCGAVTIAVNDIDNTNNSENVNYVLSQIAPAITAAPAKASINDVAKIHAKLTVGKLVNESEIIKHATENNGLKIVAAYYNLDTGKVDFLN